MTSDDLRVQLEEIADRASGRVAYVFDYPSQGVRLERDASHPFIAASIIKVPILVEAARQVAAGDRSWDDTITLRDADKVGGSGVLNVLHEGLQISLRDAIVLMTVVSDNTATNLVLDAIDVRRVNGYLEDRGCTATRCLRKLYDREAIKKGIHNRIGAAEIADILRDAAEGRLISPEADADILAILKQQQYRNKIPHLLPPGTTVANKTGSLDEVSHDAAVVYLPDGDWFVLTVFIGDLDHDEDGPERDRTNAVISAIGRACFDWSTKSASRG